MSLEEVIQLNRLYTSDSLDGLGNWEKSVLSKFTLKMTNKQELFPCIPATQGHRLNHFRYGFLGDPRSESSVEELAALLTEYTRTSKEFGEFTSLIVFFQTPKEIKEMYSVEQYEQLFWNHLNGLTKLDKKTWPKHIPVTPHEPLWEFCFHGEQYFIYCATPAHYRRKSRQFDDYMLAITPRWVLTTFEHSGTYAHKIRKHIRKRLEKYDSTGIHHSLNQYGNADNFEWKQYFLHDDDSELSKCPFHMWKKEDKEE